MRAPTFGDRVEDIITGFTGIVIGETDWMYGCKHVAVKPEKLGEDKQPQESKSFDVQRIKILKENVVDLPTPRRNFVIHKGVSTCIENGDIVKCQITGFKGVVIGITLWAGTETVISVQPQSLNKSGVPEKDACFTEAQLQIVEKKKFKRASEEEKETPAAIQDRKHPGGPAKALPRASR
jgi:hypothetical protein